MAEEQKITEETIREALRSVVDPELHLDVVTLGLIRNINLEESPPRLSMLLTTPFCPYGPWMVQMVKEAAEKTVGGKVKIEVLADQWQPDMMEDPTLLGFF